jgi:hypothetical protein
MYKIFCSEQWQVQAAVKKLEGMLGKVVPVHAMKTLRGSRFIPRLVLNLYTGWRCVVSFMPQLLNHQKEPWDTFKNEAGWAP